MVASLLLSLAVLPVTGFTQDITTEFSTYLQELSRLEESLRMEPECQAFVETGRPDCSSISDNFCSTLWNNKNSGNLPLHDGKLQVGFSPASGVRQYILTDLEALVASHSRLPADLAEKAKPTLERIDHLLKNQSSAASWYRELNELGRKFRESVEDVAEEREKKAFPDIIKKTFADRTLDERFQLNAVAYGLSDEVLNAKYKEHPNWKRVEKVFALAKEDILANIETMKVPEETKKFLRDKISTASLTLPYTNPATLFADESCGSTQVNAYYFRDRNEVVACAGLFNAYQSEAALYHVMAHELGHSVDTEEQGKHDCRTHSPVARTLNRLTNLNEPAFTCEEWKKTRATLLKPSDKFVNRRETHPLEKLSSCLKEKSGLEKLTTENVRSAASRIAKNTMSWYASNNYFLNLAQPTITRRDGRVVTNPLFMNPKLLKDANLTVRSDGKSVSTASPPEIFAQSLACQEIEKDGVKISYEKATNSADRTALFKRALEETLEVTRIQKEDFFSYCGQNCAELVDQDLASPTHEHMADWIAIRATQRYLKRIANPIHRREASAAANALFCNQPGLTTDAPELAVEEKSYSHLVHPDNRVRRISIYTHENAATLGCLIDDKNQGFALCEP